MTTVRKMTQYVPLTRDEFRKRFFERFYDPAFDDVQAELEKVCERAWDGYIKYRKSPRTQPAGGEFSDPGFALPVEWLQTRSSIKEAEGRQRGLPVPHPYSERRYAQRAHLPGRGFENAPPRRARAPHRRGAGGLRGR
jgi:hypothetical protein